MRIHSLYSKILVFGLLFLGLKAYAVQDNPMIFAQVSDVHYSILKTDKVARLSKESPAFLKDVINQINNTPNVDFVMFTGDMIHVPRRKELKGFLNSANKLREQWYVALGNHDVLRIDGYIPKREYINTVKKYDKNFRFSQSYYSFSPKNGYKVIVLDSIIGTKFTSNGEIPKKQLKWLNSQLSASKDDVVLIFLHHPIIEPSPCQSHNIINADEVLKIITKYKNPIAVFSGHYHTTKIMKRGNILFVSTPSLISYPDAFRIIKVTNEKDKVIFDIDFNQITNKDAVKRAREMETNPIKFYGIDSDRKAVYVINK